MFIGGKTGKIGSALLKAENCSDISGHEPRLAIDLDHTDGVGLEGEGGEVRLIRLTSS